VFVKQRIQTNIRVVVTLVVAVLAFAMLQTPAANAQSTANTLKVSPVRTDIEVQPGASRTVQTTVTNLTSDAITIKATSNDFIAGDELGTPALILDDDKYAPSHSLKRFIQPLANVTIPAGQAKTINVVINVPANAQAGGYFGAIRFSPTDPDGGGQVNLSASVGSLILLTVPGDFVEHLNLKDFNIQQDGITGTTFRNGTSLQAYFRFENTGSVQMGPFGKISVKKGDKVVYETDFNNKDPRDMILPDSTRRWEIPLSSDTIGGFGQYTVLGTFTYGKDNQTIEVTKTFWIIPFTVIIAGIVAILVLVGIVIGILLAIRSRKRSRRMRRGRSQRF